MHEYSVSVNSRATLWRHLRLILQVKKGLENCNENIEIILEARRVFEQVWFGKMLVISYIGSESNLHFL
ncbi:MAG TPA: hypothetical protein DCS93_09510 [Microscillaceae bacterium]|nr:hypothetical protein [Microscillaceae bacterium]